MGQQLLLASLITTNTMRKKGREQGTAASDSRSRDSCSRIDAGILRVVWYFEAKHSAAELLRLRTRIFGYQRAVR